MPLGCVVRALNRGIGSVGGAAGSRWAAWTGGVQGCKIRWVQGWVRCDREADASGTSTGKAGKTQAGKRQVHGTLGGRYVYGEGWSGIMLPDRAPPPLLKRRAGAAPALGERVNVWGRPAWVAGRPKLFGAPKDGRRLARRRTTLDCGVAASLQLHRSAASRGAGVATECRDGQGRRRRTRRACWARRTARAAPWRRRHEWHAARLQGRGPDSRILWASSGVTWPPPSCTSEI